MTTETMIRIIAETRDHYVAQAQPFGWNEGWQACCYVNYETGARCAIGRYIGDDVIEELNQLDARRMYKVRKVLRDRDPDWQDMGISDFIRLDPGILPRAPVRFLQDLQSTHDDVAYAEGVAMHPERYDAREEMGAALDRLKAKVLAGDY